MKIVFMGTPLFAVYALEAIYQSEHEIVGVVTSVDKPAGRGKQLRQSEVKKFATKNELNLLQPLNLKEEVFINDLKKLKADVFVIVAFRMLPKTVWNIPPMGTFNLHASLLPNFRGAAPINWAIIHNVKTTGVTTFFIDDEIDTGAVLLKQTISIEENETAGSLHDKLAPLGAKLILKTLNHIMVDRIAVPQKLLGSEKEAPKLTKENTKIKWEKPLLFIDGLIRGLNPFPTAWIEIQNGEEQLKIKIFKATPEIKNNTHKIGVLEIKDKKIRITHSEGFLTIDELQLPNKKKMNARALLNGYKFKKGSKVL